MNRLGPVQCIRSPINRRQFGKYVAALSGSLIGAHTLEAKAQSAAEPRRVFAHYLVCCPIVGSQATVEDFKAEIQQAQSRGVDGFALNCGSWDAEPNYHAFSKRMFDAALGLGTDFRLFFSADGLEPDVIVTMMSEFYDHPNMYRYGGKPILSTFAGNAEWGRTVLEVLRQARLEVTFVPFFYPPFGGERFPESSVVQLIADNSYVDGFFYFGASGSGKELAARSVRIGMAWRRAGKLYMAPVTPYYRGLGGNYRAFETRGFEGMALQWEAAIDAGAQWVEIVSWNDWQESTYVASLGPGIASKLWPDRQEHLLSHEAYLAASNYYIKWFKSGTREISQDELFWFYRLAPRSRPGRSDSRLPTGGFPSGSGDLEDRVFVTAFLAAPALIRIQSGDRRYEYELAAGVHHLGPEFGLGVQRFEAERGGRTILSGVGAFPIENDNWGNFNYLAGQAQAT